MENAKPNESAPPSPKVPSSSLFLSPENLCGQTLLSIVGRGHSILADIRILSDRVPAAFLAAADLDSDKDESCQDKNTGSGLFSLFGGTSSGSSSKAGTSSAGDVDGDEDDTEDVKKYVPFLFDFSYLHNPEEWEASLSVVESKTPQQQQQKSNSPETLAELEREFAVNHRAAIEEYYELFFSIYDYQAAVNQFATDLTKGYFIQYTVESVLLDLDGRALLCEAVWLYGVMLIMMERFLPGPIRERLIIAYFRFCGRDGDISRIDTICKLCKSTGIVPPKSMTSANFSSDKSFKYPMDDDKLFARYPIPVDLVRNIVGVLISDDIYQQASVFPNIDHRSIRLSRQASMLYVILYFDPAVLRDEVGKLREIVDKYFHDNWVVHVYAGLTADLSLEWDDRFPAAKIALDNVLKVDNVKRLHINNAKLIGQCMAELRAYLTMGILTDKFVLDNKHDLLNCLRRCNIAARWRILHRRTSTQTYYDIVCVESDQITTDPKLEGNFVVSDTHVVSLLLLCSQLEMQLKDIFRELLQKKGDIWMNCREQARKTMDDLADYFKGDQTLARVSRHDGLIVWFTSMSDEIRALTYESGDHFTVTGREIQLCVQALEEVEQYDLIDRDVQVKSFLEESRGLLLQMARAVGVSESICEDIRWISDMSYGIESVKSYVTIIHTRVSKDPSNVALLQGFFLKLSSSLDGPVERLKQLSSAEAMKVTEFYSAELVSFVRKVLEIVPISVFRLLVNMSDIFERRLLRLPRKVAADQLVTYSQTGERYKLSMMAHEISMFAEGILGMENSFVGGVEVNPRKLLDDGLRKEMVQHVSELMNNILQFDFSADNETTSSLLRNQASAMRSLTSLSKRLEGFRSSLDCIEDFVAFDGSKMWHEEMARIISYNVEQEVNKYLLKKVLDSDSKFQSKVIPIPRFPKTQNEPSCVNFMGRAMSMLLKITEAQYTTYSLERGGWFMSDGGTEVCGLKTVALLRDAIGIYGLVGIDRLLSYRILHELHRFVKFFRTNVSKHGVLLEQLRDELYPEWKAPLNVISIYAHGSRKTEMLMLPMLTCFRRVGQAQLLRRMIRYELQRAARVDAKLLQLAVSTLNASLLSSNQTFTDHPDDMKKLFELTIAVGSGDPMDTVFMATDPLEGLPLLLLFFIITYVPKIKYDPNYGSLAKGKGGYPIDGWPIIAGCATMLKQFHPSYAKSFLAYIGQFIRVSVQTYAEKKGKKEEISRLALDLSGTIAFACQFCDISNLPRSALNEFVPQYLLEMCHDL
eukprot:CCRYP_002429-RD/>CCRYP_002429-RD protein AED:0.28 eAED:0.28 QI:53/0.75/0.6/1/1/1/5/0/1264